MYLFVFWDFLQIRDKVIMYLTERFSIDRQSNFAIALVLHFYALRLAKKSYATLLTNQK